MKLMALMLAQCAIMLAGTFCPAQDSFRIFPPRSTLQCVIDGKAIAGFPTITALNEKFGANAALAGRAIDSPMKDKVAFCAFAVLPDKKAGEDDGGDYDVVIYIGLEEQSSFDELRGAISEMMDRGTDDNGKPIQYKTEDLAEGGLRIVLPQGGADEDAPAAFCILQATPKLAIISEKEDIARAAAGAIGAGTAIRPTIPKGNPLAWLSASINPEELFGDDDDEDDDEDGEFESPLGGMEFLSEMTNIVVVANGDAASGAIQVEAAGGFGNSASAAQAAGMLSALVQMTAFSGDDSNPLVALGKRAKVSADGSQCRISAAFPPNEIEAFFKRLADEAEKEPGNDDGHE